MDAADVLEQGAELIAQRGLAQGVFENGDGELCLLGSMRLALLREHPDRVPWEMAGLKPFLEAKAAAQDYLKNMDIAGWNDEHGRTAEEVIDTMKLVAKDLRNKA